MDLAQYDYHLPGELIARVPVEPRDSARLLVYDTAADSINLDTFVNLDRYLPSRPLLIFNNTKVLPARLNLTKPTGGRVEVLLLVNELAENDEYVKGLADRKITFGQILSLDSGHTFTVAKQDGKIFYFQVNFDRSLLPELLLQYGATPVPKYLGRVSLPEADLRQRYQSMFAEKPASVAAPTASLHFTPRVMEKLSQKNIDTARVTLHVGLGTFAPVTEQNILNKRLHEEFYEIAAGDARNIHSAKHNGQPVIAVGTTTVRTIESCADQLLNNPVGIQGKTDLFIYPPYDFKITTGLITNFHLPQSSLMCLVDAFLQNKKARTSLLGLYEIAIKNGFRFYSFGDCMLLV